MDGAEDNTGGALNNDADVTLVNTPTEPVSDKTIMDTPALHNPVAADTTVIGFSSVPDNAEAGRDGTKFLDAKGRKTPTTSITTNTVIIQDSEGFNINANSEAEHASIADANLGQVSTDTAKTSHSSAANLLHSDTMLGELVLAGLLNTEKARSIESEARNSGRTVFATIVNDSNLTNQSEIHEWGAARAACRRITASQDLHKAVRTADWLPLNSAENAGVLLLESGEGAIGEYATTDPFDVLTRDWVARCENKNFVRPVLVSPTVFKDALKRIRRDLNEEGQGEIGITVDIDWESAERLRENLEDQDVPVIVNFILFRAHALGASDIHVEPTAHSLLIRNRVDGILHDEAVMPAALHSEVASRIKILSGMDVAEKRRPQDGRVSINIHQNPIDVRVSTFPTVYGEKIVMRLLDQSSLMPSPDLLGLRPHELSMLIDGLNAPYGLIMLCGPTGSGKTTTLYSCLGSVDKSSKNVLTVEDPVEYRLEGVHQMQVNHKIGLTFGQGLRNILRQDPDIIMVGECRDLETAEMAIQASLTGHIVFSTIHTNDAIGVVSRLLDMNIDPFLVASSMTLAIAQRLVRTICPECKLQIDGSEISKKLTTDGVSEAKLELLGINIDPELQYAIGRGRGCNHCRGTGYLGRQAVFEVFQMTNKYRQIVMAETYNADELRTLAAQDGMRTLVQSGLDLVEQGETTHEEVIRVLGGGH